MRTKEVRIEEIPEKGSGHGILTIVYTDGVKEQYAFDTKYGVCMYIPPASDTEACEKLRKEFMDEEP